MKFFYHFTGDTLRNRDPIPPIGKWLVFHGKLVACSSGLHASEDPFDALQYAPGPILHRVRLGKKRISHGEPVDKWVSNYRKIVASINAEELLRKFACRVALDVLPLWPDAPAVVKTFLETRDEKLRAAAWTAAGAAAGDAAGDAARAAAGAKYRKWFGEMVQTKFNKSS